MTSTSLTPVPVPADAAAAQRVALLVDRLCRAAHPELGPGPSIVSGQVVWPSVHGRPLPEAGLTSVDAVVDALMACARGLLVLHAHGLVHGGVDGAAVVVDPAGHGVLVGAGARAVRAAAAAGQAGVPADERRAAGRPIAGGGTDGNQAWRRGSPADGDGGLDGDRRADRRGEVDERLDLDDGQADADRVGSAAADVAGLASVALVALEALGGVEPERLAPLRRCAHPSAARDARSLVAALQAVGGRRPATARVLRRDRAAERPRRRSASDSRRGRLIGVWRAPAMLPRLVPRLLVSALAVTIGVGVALGVAAAVNPPRIAPSAADRPPTAVAEPDALAAGADPAATLPADAGPVPDDGVDVGAVSGGGSDVGAVPDGGSDVGAVPGGGSDVGVGPGGVSDMVAVPGGSQGGVGSAPGRVEGDAGQEATGVDTQANGSTHAGGGRLSGATPEAAELAPTTSGASSATGRRADAPGADERCPPVRRPVAGEATSASPRHWAAIVQELLDARAAALTALDETLLCRVYAPESAGLRADRRTIAAHRAAGLRIVGWQAHVSQVQVRTVHATTAQLVVTDRLSAYRLVGDAGRVRHRVAAAPPARWQIRVVADAGAALSWRLA